MIDSIHFRNFKALCDTALPLGRFTLLVGPNGSGKSTALEALSAVVHPADVACARIESAGLEPNRVVEVTLRFCPPYQAVMARARWSRLSSQGSTLFVDENGSQAPDEVHRALLERLKRVRSYSLHAPSVARPVELEPQVELSSDGWKLAAVLDRLRDGTPERFEALNEELGSWFPEFDRILFETPQRGHRTFDLRTRQDQHRIPASDLSQGTLLALAILTVAYVPEPPTIACFEEPDRGIHPRLLRNVQEALYRLSYPESFDEQREPVQVIATTHSPYFLDLFKDHPEEIVIAEKIGHEARFHRLADRPDLDEILQDAPLGEVWYTGILGGVPAES